MKFLQLLGKRLKDDELLDLLEIYDAEVVYDFDRLHENMPDQYWAACMAQGILFSFNASQVLSTIFLYLDDLEGYTPIELVEIEDIQLFSSVQEIEAYCVTEGYVCKKGGRADVNPSKLWARIDKPNVSIHYEFVAGHLARITVSTKEATP
jgi:hypothetical protein